MFSSDSLTDSDKLKSGETYTFIFDAPWYAVPLTESLALSGLREIFKTYGVGEIVSVNSPYLSLSEDYEVTFKPSTSMYTVEDWKMIFYSAWQEIGYGLGSSTFVRAYKGKPITSVSDVVDTAKDTAFEMFKSFLPYVFLLGGSYLIFVYAGKSIGSKIKV